MVNTQSIFKEVEEEISITCDVCGKIYEDDFERQEFLRFYNRCGYGSVFGDGKEIRLDICQHCLKERFASNIKYLEY